MNSKRFFIFLVLIALLACGLWLPANAAPNFQQVVTPTAGPDGRVLYIAQPGDNCTVVAALNGITVEQLRQLNSGKINEDCVIIAGEEYLIAVISIAGTPTAGPSPTPLPPTITPTPFTGTTEICVLLFNDINGNALRDDSEPAVAGGAVSVTELNGKYSAALETVIPADPEAYQGICFTDVPEGSYSVTVGIPDNYNPTMELNTRLDVSAGARDFIAFGIQSKDVVADPGNPQAEPITPEEERSPVLGIVGGLFLLGGAGLGYYAWRANKPENKLVGGIGRR